MNSNHARVCPSPEWAAHMHTDVLPGLCAGVDLGTRMLEIGPGPGVTADWLRHRVANLVAVEIEAGAAAALRRRFAGTNVHVVHGDAGLLPFGDGSFDSAGSFTMLHHVPSAAMQNRVLAEVLRVLRPGGTLIASDSLASTSLHEFHEGDTYNPLEVASLLPRLQTIGFGAVMVSVDRGLTFRARKPDEVDEPDEPDAPGAPVAK
jgi:SAM-dependent methyltransferase